MSYSQGQIPYHGNKQNFYEELCKEATHYYSDFWLSNFSNTAALLMDQLPEINWVGFYFLQNDTLRLGPFQGLPACLDIKMGRGVCGSSALEKKSIIVPDVDEFPGHISCDSNSKSEIVVPLFMLNQLDTDRRIIGVLDIDSPVLNRFSMEDQLGLEKLMRGLIEASAGIKL